MKNQFGEDRRREGDDDQNQPPSEEVTYPSTEGLHLPEALTDGETLLTVEGVRINIKTALSTPKLNCEIDLSPSLLRPFLEADGPTLAQIVILEALLFEANKFFRNQDSDEPFLTLMEITQKALEYWFIPEEKFDLVRSKWFGFIDNLLQSEKCDISKALESCDELSLMKTTKLLAIAKRLLEVDGDRNTLDTTDLSFTVAEGCRAITLYLEKSEVYSSIADLIWLAVGELGDLAGSMALTSFDTPLFNLFEKVIVAAGYEEEFLPFSEGSNEDEDEEESDFSSSLEITFGGGLDEEEAADTYLEPQEIDEDDVWVEVSQDELDSTPPLQFDAPINFINDMMDSEYGVWRTLLALAKCQPRIPGDQKREHIWSCVLSTFSYDNPSWGAGLLGMWICNEERGKGVVRSLLMNVFGWEEEGWEEESGTEELPDETDTFALLVELLARYPQTAEGLEEVFRGLPVEVQKSISDICEDSLENGDIPVEWFDAGCKDVNKLEAEVARIFIVP